MSKKDDILDKETLMEKLKFTPTLSLVGLDPRVESSFDNLTEPFDDWTDEEAEPEEWEIKGPSFSKYDPTYDCDVDEDEKIRVYFDTRGPSLHIGTLCIDGKDFERIWKFYKDEETLTESAGKSPPDWHDGLLPGDSIGRFLANPYDGRPTPGGWCDHSSVWFDPNTLDIVLAAEPYENNVKGAQEWAVRHGWLFENRGQDQPGSYGPGTVLLLLRKQLFHLVKEASMRQVERELGR